MDEKRKLALTLSALAVSLLLFLVVLNAPLSAIMKFALAAVVLAGCGFSVAKLHGFECFSGLFLLRSKHGLGLLDELARKHPQAWQLFAEIGMVVGYGSLAYFLMGKKKLEWRRALIVYGSGTFLLVVISGIIPLAMSSLLSMVTGGEEFATAGLQLQTEASKLEFFRYLSFACMIIGGVSLVATISIITYAGVVAGAIGGALLGNGAQLAKTTPGGMPILPGINLDLIQGVFALAIVLVVHEGMHGIVARVHKLPLKSAGLVFFGFLPFGAFVDIDEKRLFAEKKEKQNAVLVAGTAANFATSIFFLALLLAFIWLVESIWTGPTPPFLARYAARFLALTFALNAIVASVNLVPLPMFDGHYIMKNLVGSKHVATAITWIVGIAFLLTMFPWVLR